MSTPTKLFSEFSPVSKQQWHTKVVEDLKGGDFDKKLVWKTDDNFSIQPFYTHEDIEGSELLKNQYKLFAASSREWINYVEIKVENEDKANEMATEMKNFGANGFLFKITATPDFSVLLKGLNVEEDLISFSIAKPSAAVVSAYFDFLKSKNIKAEKVKGFFEADILEELSTAGTTPDFDALAGIIKITKAYPCFKGLVVRSHAFVNAGSNITQEIAFTLNKLADYIEQLSGKGFTAEEILNETMLHTAIGGDYFFEIAKLRSLRVLLNNILELYGYDASKIGILSSNAVWSKSFYDPNVNMLRNTTEAMSALLGGCNGLLTYAHDASYKEPTKFSQRIALNISNLLKSESYFDKVADPSAGSYYIESLTGNITEHSLSLFKSIEEKGGYINAFTAGFIQEKIKEVKDKKEKEVISRKRVYVGANKFPDLLEKTIMETENKNTLTAKFPLLVAQRVTKPFEDLKNRTLTHFNKTGFLPKIYPACFGDMATRKARATFAGEFFGTAGFEVMDEHFFDDVQKAAEESAKSNANIIVICSSDAEYETHAIAFVEKFKSISKDKLLVLAGYPETIVEQLKKAGIDGFVHLKSNAVTDLSEFQNKLGVK